jgi:ATP-dependent HslUV protease subunit HslV
VELAKDWRSDRYLRRLDALMITGDPSGILMISGIGDVMEPDDGIIAIGSGGNYALSAARALAKHSQLSNPEIVKEALLIASDICVFTNKNIVIEEL